MPTLSANERLGTLVGGGRYHVRSVLGEGGFSSVFEAVHTVTGREVALKLLHPHLVATEQISERFLNEARAMARIRHDGIVQVFDAGRDPDGTVFIALELLAGETLEATLSRVGQLTWGETAAIGLDVLEALAEAHRNGIIHRDIKPGNIFIVHKPDGSSQAKLLDFGIAHVAQVREGRLTERGMILGTPEYMSPEQGRSGNVGPGSDIWSVGILLFECLTGTTPFVGETATEILLKVATDRPPPLRSVAPHVPPPIAAVVDRALERDMEVRYVSAASMRDALVAARASVDAPPGPLNALRAPTLPAIRNAPASNPGLRRAAAVTLAAPESPAERAPVSSPGLSAPQSSPSARTNLALDRDPMEAARRSTSGVRSRDLDPAPMRDGERHSPPPTERTSYDARRASAGSYEPPAPAGTRPGVLVAGLGVLVIAAVVGVVATRAVVSTDVAAPVTPRAQPDPTENPSLPHAAPAMDDLQVQSSITPPPGVSGPDNAAEFARHVVVSPTAGTTQRVVATCVPGGDGQASAYLFALVGGTQLASSRGEVTCSGNDLAVVPDMTGDGTDDVVAISPGGTGLAVLDSRTMRSWRTVALPGVRGVVGGLVVRGEPIAVAYVDRTGESPSSVVAVSLQSQNVLWRVQGAPSVGPLGDPGSQGLAVGPDATGDGVPDVVIGAGPGAGSAAGHERCVLLVSGVDGRPAWPAPFCQGAASGPQAVSMGPDVDGDGRGDIAIGVDGPAAGEPHVVLVSGATARVLRAVPPPEGDAASDFGWPLALGGDVDGDGTPDLVVGSGGMGAAVSLFDAATARRVAHLALGNVGGSYVRVSAVPPTTAHGRWSVVVSDPAGGIRVLGIPATP